jgi:SAM-dependent methyltransferase
LKDILDGYASAATPAFIAAYEALSPERIYEHVSDLFPSTPARVADIGAGTGRDAAWFAQKGHSVAAIEPVRELRDAGRETHHAERIEWVDDCLPSLTKLRLGAPFNLVTLCGVWQHVEDQSRATAMASLAAITAPHGLLIMSLRHGPGAPGRRVFPVSAITTIEAAQGCGFQLVREREADSIQAVNRDRDVTWTWLVLEKIAR